MCTKEDERSARGGQGDKHTDPFFTVGCDGEMKD